MGPDLPWDFLEPGKTEPCPGLAPISAAAAAAAAIAPAEVPPMLEKR